MLLYLLRCENLNTLPNPLPLIYHACLTSWKSLWKDCSAWLGKYLLSVFSLFLFSVATQYERKLWLRARALKKIRQNTLSFSRKDNTDKYPVTFDFASCLFSFRYSILGYHITVMQPQGGLSKTNVVTSWYVYSGGNLFQGLIRHFWKYFPVPLQKDSCREVDLS